MNEYEKKLQQYLKDNQIEATHVQFEKIVHSVEDACRETGGVPDDFVKTICLIASDDSLICALVLGSSRVSTSKVGRALGIERPPMATPEQALEKTGYKVGGTPPFGYKATILMDPLIMERDEVYVGGGGPRAMVKMTTKELLRVSGGTLIRVRKLGGNRQIFR